ncbi:oligosaccharide flippase family protein [Duganella sp. FT50W]|uniref:Oligosaccharide flippase family protein n=1 Tax=Duganella lactea TaxID=2692173 RepID=A0A6L8MPS9_9BURK|nr:oligosaccharide flippase family protein [Duganella lactea]MYM82945.1 oligosaccharide flippase family protein [Duganella lactea]
MAIKQNIVANYASQLYATLVSIVMVPIYIRYVGVEAYGLIGFFSVIQAWFLLLDVGLSPTFSRQVARFRAGAVNITELRQLLHALEGLFFLIAIIACGTLYYFSGNIATSWLKIESIPQAEVERCLAYMIVVVALRWMSGLYIGAINGFEKQVWLSTQNFASSTLRFVVVVGVFEIWGPSISHFFAYQVLVALLELTLLSTKLYRLLPRAQADAPWSWTPLRGALRFSGMIALNALAWAFVTQLDKLLLSKLLPLSSYAHFTMAVVVASGVGIVTAPIGSAILPRLSKLEAEGNHSGLIALYRKGTQFATIMAAAASVTLAVFAQQVLTAWTGDTVIAAHAAPILQFYAVANGLLAIAVFPYYLQFAKGNLKLHLVGNLVFAVGLVPLILFLVDKYGALGAGYAWMARNALYFAVWIPLVHLKFAPGLNKPWLLSDILPIYIVVTLVVVGTRYLLALPDQRLLTAGAIGLVGALAVAAGVVVTPSARSILTDKLRLMYLRRYQPPLR